MIPVSPDTAPAPDTAALEQEGFAPGDGGEPGAQLVALTCEDEGRIGSEVGKGLAQSLVVRPFGLLRRGKGLPGVALVQGFSVHGHAAKATGSHE